MERAAARLRHGGKPELGPGVVWRQDGGWRFACPLGCAVTRGEIFGSAAEAARAFVAHWAHEQDAELTSIARSHGGA
jgi:hypothetical protein